MTETGGNTREGREDHQRTILFCPINSAGHLNSSLAIADRLRQDHPKYRLVFVLLGPPHNEAIARHGHELVILEDKQPYEDFELEEGDDPLAPVDEERKRAEGKSKRRFVGARKWPQMILRSQKRFQSDPLESILNAPQLAATIGLGNLQTSEAQYVEAIERFQPDLILADTYLPPACFLLNEHRRPWVRIHSANPMMCCRPRGVAPPSAIGAKLYTRQERDRLRLEEPHRWLDIEREWTRVREAIRGALADSYAPVRAWYAQQDPSLEGRLELGEATVSSPLLNLYLFPEALDYDQEEDLFEYPPRWLRCESLLRSSLGQSELSEDREWTETLDERMVGKSGMIFFSLGSIASANIRLMQKYAEILEEDAQRNGRLYVVSKGVFGDKYELGVNMVGGNYVPQTLILRRAQLAIIHGGNNSITECLHFGVPMIVMPNFSDQFDNAQRVEDLGLGRRLDLYKCTREELLGAVNEILADGPLIERLGRIGEHMRRRDDLGMVSNVIEQIVERGGRLDEETGERFGIKLA